MTRILLIAFHCVVMLTTSMLMLADVCSADSGRSASGKSVASQSGPELSCPVALNWAITAPRVYYMVYGYWPETWSHIVDSGLMTTQLRTPAGELIDLDDHSLDFIDDMHYIYKGPQTEPKLALLQSLSDGTTRVKYEAVTGAIPFAQVYSVPIPNASTAYNQKLAELAQSVLRRHQLGMMHMVKYAQNMYFQLNGRFGSWDQLHAAGLMPVGRDTVNPQTGLPWRGDGSANDLKFHLNDKGMFMCLPTDATGETPWQIL